MVRINSTRLRANNRHPSIVAHYCYLLFVATLGLVFCFYLMLSSQEAKMNSIRMVVNAHSASSIASSGKPFLLYGTAWKKEETARYVAEAIHAGFRFIDTACQPKHYNEAGVGNGWKAAADELGLQRSDLFLQTKYTPYPGQDPNRVPYDHTAPIEEQVKQSLAVSLKNLHTDYLDSLVMHSPLDTVERTMEAWRVMETFVDDGKVHRLGISNCYDYNFYTAIYNQARIKPSVLQNRFYAESNFDTKLRQFCKEKGIWYQSFWTLTGNRQALALPQVKHLAEKKNLTPQTLMYAFMMSLGYATPLDGTTNKAHMLEDVAVMERMQGGEKIFETQDELKEFAAILGMPEL
mmetsp:Transcript_18671/g.33780  ORF Transcript_18671/g.33780 Transcript_18671/m.33780 type:complete len:349 (+) Transcript_18671:113-1159(+)